MTLNKSPRGKIKKKKKKVPIVSGWRELVHLPDLGIGPIVAKLDTGARTAALHAENIEIYETKDGDRISFDAFVDDSASNACRCDLPLTDTRRVKSTSGTVENRSVIETRISMGGQDWVTEISLTDRAEMGVPMLLGRATIKRRVVVHPGRTVCTDIERAQSSPRKGEAEMKIALMTRNANLYSHQRLIEVAQERGHEIDPIDYLRCYMNITSHRPELRFMGERLLGYDAVIPRIAASRTYYGLAVLRQFEMMGVWPVNESVAIGRSRDKLRSMQLLSRDGIGLPVTAFAHDTKQTDEVIKIAGGAPCVVKLLEGTQGIGVVLGETQQFSQIGG